MQILAYAMSCHTHTHIQTCPSLHNHLLLPTQTQSLHTCSVHTFLLPPSLPSLPTFRSSAPSQCVQFSAHSTDPLSFLKSKTPPVGQVLDTRLRSSVEVSCSDEEELFNKNVSPKKAVSKQITKRIFFPEESSLTAPPPLKDLTPKVENRDLPQKPSNRRNQKVVTFKVEGTDPTDMSGPSQLQQVTTASFVLQTVPTTTTTTSGVVETTGSPEVTAAKIANIKKMLFGEKESAVTQRYRKDSGTTEPCAERLLGGGESQKGDSNNNSNCSKLYEVPWEQKPVAKYAPEFRKYENVHVGVAERQAGRGVLCRPVMVQASRTNTAGVIGVGGGGDQASQLPEAKVNPSEKKCNGGGLTSPLSTSSSTGMMWTEALGKVQSSLPRSSQGGQSLLIVCIRECERDR